MLFLKNYNLIPHLDACRGKSTPDRVLEVREDVVKGYLPPLDREYKSSKDQIQEVLKQIRVVLPIKFETRKHYLI